MEEGAKEIVKGYMSDFERSYFAFISILVGLRQICSDISLCSANPRAALLPGKIQDVRNNATLLQKLLSELPSAEDFTCVICRETHTDIIITCCAHTFCKSCITKTLKELRRNCPICRNPLSESDLFKAPSESFQTNTKERQSHNLSSKVIALREHLCKSRVTNPYSKSVIFTPFIKMLPIPEKALIEVGFKVICLDSSMIVKKKDRVIRDFSVTLIEESTILLASLKVSESGIKLRVALTVSLLEPWWNPAIEAKTLDCVNSIEREDGVQIVQFIVRNTIEKIILKLQEDKRGLAEEAFAGRGQKNQREITKGDVTALMNL